MPDPEILPELAASDTGWDEPNERTSVVDDALVRACRALDSCAEALAGLLRRDVTVESDSEGGSQLTFSLQGDGRWRFEGGAWVGPDGTLDRSVLLRPALRPIARAARPDHEEVLAVVVRDLDVAEVIAEHTAA